MLPLINAKRPALSGFGDSVERPTPVVKRQALFAIATLLLSAPFLILDRPAYAAGNETVNTIVDGLEQVRAAEEVRLQAEMEMQRARERQNAELRRNEARRESAERAQLQKRLAGPNPFLGQKPEPAGSAVFARAFDLLKTGEMDVSISMFQAGLKQNPKSGPAHLYLAYAYTMRKQPSDDKNALEHYTRASELLGANTADGVEAMVRATELQKNLAPIDLAATPQLLDGTWCTGSYKVVFDTRGTRFRTGPGPSEASHLVAKEGSRFTVEEEMPGAFFGTTTHVNRYEMVERNKIVHVSTEWPGGGMQQGWTYVRCK